MSVDSAVPDLDKFTPKSSRDSRDPIHSYSGTIGPHLR